MTYLRVNDIAKILGCPNGVTKYFRESKNNVEYSLNGSIYGDTDAQATGTKAHELVQYVLESNEREEKYEKISNALDPIEIGMELPEIIEEIIGNELLLGRVHDKALVKFRNEASDLLRCSNQLLDYLEKIPGTKGKWRINIEDSIHEKVDLIPGSYHKTIFENIIFIHGNIDLIFKYEDMLVVAEMKTGSHQGWKEDTWDLQTQIYIDACEHKYPNKKVRGFAIHKSLDGGFKHINRNPKWADYFVDKKDTIPGEHCFSCNIKAKCPNALIYPPHPR
jgi:ATP-dependent exoDNAse (exonuclease V) beta subunit